MDDAMWNHAVFSKNRDRLLTSDVAQPFFVEVNKQARRLMSDEHFTVDGTLIQAGFPTDRSSSAGTQVENRNGLIAAAMVTHADGDAERDAAATWIEEPHGSPAMPSV
jgi:hypothetical protein